MNVLYIHGMINEHIGPFSGNEYYDKFKLLPDNYISVYKMECIQKDFTLTLVTRKNYCVNLR